MSSISNRQVILASQSPQRLKLMQTLGVAFEQIPAGIDEKSIRDADPRVQAQLTAKAKAEAVQAKYPAAIVIAADTFVLLADQILEKPADLTEARAMLEQLSDTWAEEITGFCYLDSQKNLEITRVATTRFKMRPLSAADIDRYLANEPVLTWSAAFSPAYDSGIALIQEVQGSLTSFTHGLPLHWVVEGLESSGV